MRRENTCDRAHALRGMRRVAVLLSALAALGVVAALPAGALAVTTPSAPAAAPAGPAPGAMKLALQHVSGRPLFSVVGRSIVVRGSVTRYVAGQTIVVGFYLEGRKIATDVVGVQPAGTT